MKIQRKKFLMSFLQTRTKIIKEIQKPYIPLIFAKYIIPVTPAFAMTVSWRRHTPISVQAQAATNNQKPPSINRSSTSGKLINLFVTNIHPIENINMEQVKIVKITEPA